jgi:hypothetical protein
MISRLAKDGKVTYTIDQPQVENAEAQALGK